MKTARQYYIDWIRVVAFGILILFHTGMFFVSWSFHVKNNEIVRGLEPYMLFFNQWRLPLLFFISGVGVSFALKSRTSLQFLWERTRRLLIPLVFGMFVIVPPQIFFERLQLEQFSGSFIEFYPKVLELQSYPAGNFSWHHLWFLIYLFVYCLLCLPLFQGLRTERGQNSLAALSKSTIRPFRILFYALPLMIIFWLLAPLFPVTHNLLVDWFNHGTSILLFVFGYVLGSRLETWEMLDIHRKKYLILSIVLLAILYLFAWTPLVDVHLSPLLSLVIYGFLRTLAIWSAILTICGYFKHYLNKSNAFITYATEAVLPFYIIHQTITVSVGYYIADWRVFWGLKFLLLVLATFGGSALIFHYLIRPFNFMRFIFGLKIKLESMTAKQIIRPALNFSIVLSLLILVFQVLIWAKTEPMVPHAIKATTPPELDGILGDAAWKEALVFSDFKNLHPHPGRKPGENTICYLTYDSDNLYVGIHALDSQPDKIKATENQAENIRKDDWVAFCIDTYSGEKGTFFFMVTPKELQNSGTLNYRDGNTNNDKLLKWECAAKITADGWIAEMKIPVQQLQIKKVNPVALRFKAARYISRLDEENDYPEIIGESKPHTAQLKKLYFDDLAQ
jgi:glucans biosynthesis protein C